MTEPNTPQKLDYAPRPSERHHFIRQMVVGFMALCLGTLVLKLGPVLWHRAQLLYWQSRCMSYQASPGPIVFSSPSAIHDWQVFYAMISPPGLNSYGTLFLHDRTSKSGNRRLVAVDGLKIWSGSSPYPSLILNFSIHVIKPGSLWSNPKAGPSYTVPLAIAADAIYAGQIDSNDSTHFMIRVLTTQTERIIDGWLLDDDRVVLEARRPEPLPTTQLQGK
jgi:hypothetical protein